MSTLRSVLLTLTLASAAVPANAATIVDFIDGTGAQSFAGVTTPGTDPSDWFTFYGTAGTAIVLETLPPQFFDTIIRLYRTPLGPAVAGSLVNPRTDFFLRSTASNLLIQLASIDSDNSS